ncbi:MAG: T9SS type A sorting domain-containing protein [Ignavibacterium sp.]|nr:T9SS type A sorting domain-containing protein [Ignavibacterium sp.]
MINATAHSSGVQYTLTVNNVTDLAGNLISTTHNLTEYAFSPSNVKGEEVPTEFLLAQNYPNPFNPSTKISWQSPVAGHQTLKVYDVLGNEVATLIDEFRAAGSYKVEFNPDNLSSGVYIYCLKTGEFTQTKKMVLLR